MSKRFRVTFDMVFEDEDDVGIDENIVNVDSLKNAIDAGFEERSYDLFGESVCMEGLLTPNVSMVEEV